MADDNVVETATTEEPTQAEETPEQETSAETENTETAPDPAEEENRIPYARFSKVVQERNAAREENERLKAGTTEEPVPAAEDDDARAQARVMIEADAKAMFEREFGMPMAEVKSRIAASDNYSQDYVERKWAESCKPHGLDPSDADLQSFVSGMVRHQDVDLDAALKKAEKYFGKTAKSTPSASVEEGGVSGTMTKSDAVFWDKRSASEAAKKGIKSPHVDIMDILNKRREAPS